MKTFFCANIAASTIALTSLVCQESTAQYVPPGQAPQGYAQPAPANNTMPQSAMMGQNDQEARIRANLAQLSPEDQQLVLEQGFCPIMTKNRLGAMGPPVKLMIKDQPVFVCCKGCAAKAAANPDRTLATVAKLKARTADAEISSSLAQLSPPDRQLAEAQGYCPIMTENRLGVMGPPVKVMIGNQPVFLCCAGCKKKALSNPNQTLATVAQLKAKVAENAAQRAMVEQGRAR